MYRNAAMDWSENDQMIPHRRAMHFRSIFSLAANIGATEAIVQYSSIKIAWQTGRHGRAVMFFSRQPDSRRTFKNRLCI
jgi:hypothetical protein